MPENQILTIGYAFLVIWNSGKWNSVKWNETRGIGAIFACFYVARVWQRQLGLLVYFCCFRCVIMPLTGVINYVFCIYIWFLFMWPMKPNHKLIPNMRDDLDLYCHARSRTWPFRVTWRHRYVTIWFFHSQVVISYRCSIGTKSVSLTVVEIKSKVISKVKESRPFTSRFFAIRSLQRRSTILPLFIGPYACCHITAH